MHPGLLRASGAVGRGSAFVSAWLATVAIGAAGYGLGDGIGSRWMVPFAGPFAVALAVAVSVAWAIEGHRRRSAALLASLAAFLLGVAGLVALMLWAFRVKISMRLGIPYQAYGGFCLNLLSGLGWMAAGSMIGAIPGLPAGLVAGGLLVLARRKAHLAVAIAAGSMLAIGIGGPDLLEALTRLVLRWRSEGGQWNAAGMHEGELAILLGACSGSVVGAILAGLASRLWRGQLRGDPKTNGFRF